MYKALFATLAVSLLVNLVFIYKFRMETTFLPREEVAWGFDSKVTVSGTLIFTNPKSQPDPKALVQYLTCRVDVSGCECIEVVLMGSHIPRVQPTACERLSFRPDEKLAVFKWQNCVITASGREATFACPDEKTGTLGSHISLFYRHYSF